MNDHSSVRSVANPTIIFSNVGKTPFPYCFFGNTTSTVIE